MISHSPLVQDLIALALREDLSMGDITGELSIPSDARSKAHIRVKEDGIIAGLPLIEIILRIMNSGARFTLKVGEGSSVNKGTVVAVGEGSTRDLLAAERTLLNFLQRISGVATHTKKIVAVADGLKVLDTRKTLPGWRILDKYGVRIGGGVNHRFSLGDMVLVKNNHIDAGGGVSAVLTRIMKEKPRYMPVEVEVRTIPELKEVLPFSPSIIMLDNMGDEEVKTAVALIRAASSSMEIEVSGGVTPERLAALKAIGVTCVSMGALTTKAPNLDISMKIGSF